MPISYKQQLANLRYSRTRKAKKKAKARYEAKKALLPTKPKKETGLQRKVQRRFLYAIYKFVSQRQYWPTPKEARYVLEAWERIILPTYKMPNHGVFPRIVQGRRLYRWLVSERGKELRVLPLEGNEHYARRRDHQGKVLGALLEKGELELVGKALRITLAGWTRLEKEPIEAIFSTDRRRRRIEVQDRTALHAAQRLLCLTQQSQSSHSPASSQSPASPDGPTPSPA